MSVCPVDCGGGIVHSRLAFESPVPLCAYTRPRAGGACSGIELQYAYTRTAVFYVLAQRRPRRGRRGPASAMSPHRDHLRPFRPRAVFTHEPPGAGPDRGSEIVKKPEPLPLNCPEPTFTRPLPNRPGLRPASDLPRASAGAYPRPSAGTSDALSVRLIREPR
jgi:hypothetical protein